MAVVQAGTELLPHCDLYGMHMPLRRIVRHRRISRFKKNTQMRWRRRDVAIAARCLKATFRLTGQEEAEFIEVVEVLKHLGLMLDR